MAGKHGPNRLRSYFETHDTVMERLRRGGFVVSDDLTYTSGNEFILIEGRIECLGGIFIKVKKRVDILRGEGTNVMVKTATYTYHAGLTSHGSILRYDSPHHPAHNFFHHVHRYDVLNGDLDGVVEEIETEEQIPLLSEVIMKVEDWYYENKDHFLTD